MAPKTPKTSFSPSSSKQPKISHEPAAFKHHYASWQIGIADFDGEFGLAVLDGKIKFSLSDELIQSIGNDPAIFNVLDELDRGGKFENIHVFFEKIRQRLKQPLPNDVTKEILRCVSRYIFLNEVYPKLKEFERLNWHEIETQTSGKGKTKSHTISISDIKKPAQKRLAELQLDDIHELFSLRLDGKFRIYGIRKFGYLQIIWFDPEHEIYDFD